MGTIVILAPLIGPGMVLLVGFYVALRLLGIGEPAALAAISGLAVGGMCCGMLGHYIGAAASCTAGNYRLLTRAGAFFGIGLLVTDPLILDALVSSELQKELSVASLWRSSSWIAAGALFAICKVTLGLSIVITAIEIPLSIVKPRGRGEIFRLLTSLRPFLLIGCIGLTSSYLVSLWEETFRTLVP